VAGISRRSNVATKEDEMPSGGIVSARARLKDGRTLEYVEAGTPDSPVVVIHHGTPGSSLVPPDLVTAASERGLRLVAYCRAGYASSSRQAGRDIAAAALDVAEVLDALNVDKFATIGWSGGGPHALACASLLAARCAAALSVAGVAPYLPGEFDWTEGMSQENVDEFAQSLEEGAALDGSLGVFREFLLALRPDEIESPRDLLGDLVSEADLKATTPKTAAFLLANFVHGIADGTSGWRDDDQAFVHPWGFDVGSIEVPVSIWFGDQDLMVPARHGEWLGSHVPRARVRRFPDDGHLSLMMNRSGELLDEVLDLAGAKW
jgi:pimeloyl-ACP methyl ester carboxylesterase